MAGVTPTGFETKTLETIESEIKADLLGDVDPALDLGAETPFGQTITTFGNQLAEAWEALRVVYGAINPKEAEDFTLDMIGVFRGVNRLTAKKGRVVCDCTFNDSLNFFAGQVIAQAGNPSNRWVSVQDYTFYSAGTYPVVFECETTGPIAAPAGTLTEIVTPQGPWTAVTNPLDASLGRNRETDTEYRIRQDSALAQAGACTLDAIRAALVGEDGPAGVLSAVVLENTGDIPDADGVPPKSFEAVIWSGDPPTAIANEIAATILANKPAGISSAGSQTGTAVDALGVSQTLRFSWGTARPIYISLTVATGPGFPGAAAVKDRLVEYLSGKASLGGDVVALAARACVLEFAGGVAGVTDVPVFTLGFEPAPINTANLTVAPREIATFAASNISVTVT